VAAAAAAKEAQAAAAAAAEVQAAAAVAAVVRAQVAAEAQENVVSPQGVATFQELLAKVHGGTATDQDNIEIERLSKIIFAEEERATAAEEAEEKEADRKARVAVTPEAFRAGLERAKEERLATPGGNSGGTSSDEVDTAMKKDAGVDETDKVCCPRLSSACDYDYEAVLRSRKEAEEARAAQCEFARGHCVVMVSSLLLYGVHV
jgi:hypothetical protein